MTSVFSGLLLNVSVWLIAAGLLSADEPAAAGSLPPGRFVNPIAEGADPWVTRDPVSGDYLWCFSHGNRGISLSRSQSLTRIGRQQIVWQAPQFGPFSREIWAPELHFLDDRWYIYFSASDGRNENHQAYVLQSASADPFSAWTLHGPLRTGQRADADSPPIWAIDMTVLQLRGRRYAVWSGWDAPGTEPGTQHRGLNEGPQVFQQRDRTWLVYSCGASWLPTYKLGLLELIGNDPLNPDSWRKHPEPVFQGTDQT